VARRILPRGGVMARSAIPPRGTKRPSAIERLERVGGALLGQAIHAVVSDLLTAGVRELDQDQLFAAVASHHLILAQPVSERHFFKQRVITGVASYFRFFLPPPSWKLLGCEVPEGVCSFDLVWETPEREIFVDEIKAGRLATRIEREAVEGQLARELAAANCKWLSRFAGIRLLWIGAPLHAVLVRPDGVREGIWEVE
jgi:hypothetical protein